MDRNNNEEVDDDDDDELLFSDHVGLFKSINNSNKDIYKDTTTSSFNDNEFKKKLDNYILSSNEHHYKLCRLSNEQLNYDLDSINNWSMRFSNEFSCLQQQQQQHKSMKKLRQSTSTTRTGSCSSQTTTSWNKLKNNSKSNQNLHTSSTTTTSSANETPLIKYYRSKQALNANTTTTSVGSTVAVNTDDNNDGYRVRKSNHLLSKSPTITFGEIRKRGSSRNMLSLSSSSSASVCSSISICKQSIGTQFPPYLMDQSIQTSIMMNEKKANYHKVNVCLQATEADIMSEQQVKTKKQPQKSENIKFFYKSLPDLTFLNNYKDTPPSKPPPETTPAPKTTVVCDNEIKLLISLSSIDKQRKTLKSIKRYRQTKQNTEPISNQIQPLQSLIAPIPQFTSQQPRKLKTSESFSVKRTSNATATSSNTSSSSSSSGYISADRIANMQLTTIATIKPLNRMQCVPTTASQPLKSCLKRKDSASSNSSEMSSVNKIATIRRYNSIAATTPSIKISCERVRLSPNYLYGSRISDEILNSMPIFIQSIGWLFTCDLKSLKSYSYYKKLKKSNTKLAQQSVLTIDTSKINVIKEDEEEEEEEEEDEKQQQEEQTEHECKLRNAQSDNDLSSKKCVSFNETISHHTMTPQSQASPLHEQTNKAAAPLKYNTLINLLNSKSEMKLQKIIHKQDSIEQLKTKLVNSNKNNNIYIDADSISLGSLTESPPNEFKFSEDEDIDNSNTRSTAVVIDLNNYFTSSQQHEMFSELKVVLIQLNEIYLKEQVSYN